MPRTPQSSSSSAKRWLLVLNNYSEDERSEVIRALRELCSYVIIARELGEGGTPHLQGYFILKDKCRLRSLKDAVSQRAHFEVARGSPDSNRTYCSKEGNFEEIGVAPKANGHKKTRDDLAVEWNTAFHSGRVGLSEFADTNPGCYSFSRHIMLRNSLAASMPRERPGVRVEWLYGPPGVGKSRMAHERMPNAFIKDPMTKWWSGYMLESDVIIDDMGKNGINLNHLLRWFDRYKCLVETKGDVIPLFADNFIVTSNFHPKDIYLEVDGTEHMQLPALLRRMRVTHVLPPL